MTDPIRDELKWIAAELGGARDAEVLRMRLLAELAEEPDDLVLGPISARIEAELLADHRKAHDALVESPCDPSGTSGCWIGSTSWSPRRRSPRSPTARPARC